MKTVSSEFLDAMKSDLTLRAIPRAVVDWNLNRYVDVSVTNTPSEDTDGFDIELFPIESVIAPDIPRPTKGINKARIGQGTVSSDYFSNNGNGRYYVCDVDDEYKYWTSPNMSNDSDGTISGVDVRVVYASSVTTNKIVIKTENSWATMQTFTIYTSTDGSTWSSVATEAIGNSWKSSGVITLYWDGDSWGLGTRVDDENGAPETTEIRGVRLVVTNLEGGYKSEGTLQPTTYLTSTGAEFQTDGENSRFDLIEIAAHLEVDVSSHIVEFSTDLEISEQSVLYPLGTITSNQGTLILSNIYPDNSATGLFSKSNTDTNILWSDYLEPNARVDVTLDYYNEADEFLGNIPQFVGYTNGWTGQDTDLVSVELEDFSKFFNTIIVRAAMWEALTVPELLWRILDQAGFINYQIDRDPDRVTEHTIPVFYTDGEQNVWEVLDELAKASQTAIYFDAQGVMQVKTRDFAFSADDAPVWNFTSVPDSGYQVNIESVNQTVEYEPNHIKVIYQKTNWSDWNNGQPSMQMVWQPEGTESIRCAPLIRHLGVADTSFYLGSGTVEYWPFVGKVNIQGEIIAFDAKQLVYYTGTLGNVSNTVWVESFDDYKEKLALTPPAYAYKNHLTGAMRISERGVWNSDPKIHYVEANGYSVHGRVGHTYSNNVGGFTFLRNESKVKLSSPAQVIDAQDWVIASQSSDATYRHYGTRFRFVPGGGVDQRAGLVICNQGSGEGGYYIELRPSSKVGTDQRELTVYSREPGGAFSGEVVGQKRVSIGENIEYELDIYHSPIGSQRIQVWINGKSVANWSIPGDEDISATGKFGMYIRGHTTAKFEYLYAIGRDDVEPPDEFGFLDKVDRGYTGSQWDREWVYRWRTQSRRVKKVSSKEQARWNAQFFDEFGPYVHEIKEYDVNFEPAPVLHSRIYSTNDWGAAVLEYSGDPNGAKFIIANTSRNNVVLNGEDSLTFAGTEQSIEQTLCVLGRALIIEEAEEHIVTNDAQIRRRGRIETELTSPWIQNLAMAKDLANWISAHWSYGDSNITIKAFGNPLIEIGDVVEVNIPEKYITGDFFVTSVTTEWNEGIDTEFGLRRRS